MENEKTETQNKTKKCEFCSEPGKDFYDIWDAIRGTKTRWLCLECARQYSI